MLEVGSAGNMVFNKCGILLKHFCQDLCDIFVVHVTTAPPVYVHVTLYRACVSRIVSNA